MENSAKNLPDRIAFFQIKSIKIYLKFEHGEKKKISIKYL